MRKSIALLLATALLTGCAGINTTHAAAPSSMTAAASTTSVQTLASDSPEDILQAATQSGTPLVNGPELTFVYQGKPGDEVEVAGGVNLNLVATGKPGFFTGSVAVPDLAHAIISYTLVVNGKSTRDPLSHFPTMTDDSPVVVFRGAQAPHPAEITPNPKVPAGSVTEYTLSSTSLNESRKVYAYLPPGFSASKTYPTLLLADGQMYFEGSIHLATILDNLIAEGKIPPVAAIGVESHLDTRTSDYIFKQPRFDPYQTFVRNELLPWALRNLGLSPAVGELIPVGLSNGGAWALYTSMIEPDQFAGAILQSALTTESSLPGMTSGKRYFLSAGTLDPSAVSVQGQLAPLLKQAGNQVQTVTGVGGHDAAMMESQLVEGLSWVLGK